MQKLQDMLVWSLGGEDPLEEGTATHSSILAWRIPWTEEPGGLQSIGLQRVGHDWSDLARTHMAPVGLNGIDLDCQWLHCVGEGKGNPLQYSCLENPMDRGAWWATVHRVAKSWTRLKRLSTHTHGSNGCKWDLLGLSVTTLCWRRKWKPTPPFLPGELHGQKRLVGYSPWGRKESDMTEWLNNNMC